MGLFIGDGSPGGGPSTWGALRSIVYNGNITSSYLDEFGDHNVAWATGFKTTDGNGLVRTDYSPIYWFGVGTGIGANFTASGITDTPPTSEFGSYYIGSTSGMLVNEDRLQFTGETAVLASGSITITSDAFIGTAYQTYYTYDAAESITSIGKLTAF